MLRSLKFFSLYAWCFLSFNLYTILGGAFVRATGSGAGCGAHWPLCKGELVPQFGTLHTIIEFTHRVSSGVVGIGSVIFLILAFLSTSPKDPIRKAATAAFLFVVFEALLGAGLVLFGLVADNSSITRAVITSLHLVSTFLLIASLSLAAAWSSGWPVISFAYQDRKKLWIACFLTLGLLITGTSGAITALGDTLFRPSHVGENLMADLTNANHFLKGLRIYHPVFATIFGILISLFAIEWTNKESSQAQKKTCFSLIFLIGIQIFCGFLNIFFLAPVWMQILHLFIADLVWILSVLFFNAVFQVKEKPTIT